MSRLSNRQSRKRNSSARQRSSAPEPVSEPESNFSSNVDLNYAEENDVIRVVPPNPSLAATLASTAEAFAPTRNKRNTTVVALTTVALLGLVGLSAAFGIYVPPIVLMFSGKNNLKNDSSASTSSALNLSSTQAQNLSNNADEAQNLNSSGAFSTPLTFATSLYGKLSAISQEYYSDEYYDERRPKYKTKTKSKEICGCAPWAFVTILVLAIAGGCAGIIACHNNAVSQRGWR